MRGFVVVGVLAAAFLGACAAPAGDSGGAAVVDAVGEAPADASPAVVPDLVGQEVAAVDKLAAAAGVVAVIEHDPDAPGEPGTVVRVRPPAGTAAQRGATVTVTVAGAPGGTLDDLVAADRRNFVGLGADPDGTLVIAAVEGADADAALRRIQPAIAGRKHRVVRCATSWVELSKIVIELGQRAELRGKGSYSLSVEPAACAVRVEGEIPAETATALRGAYGDAVLVVPGSARRAVGTS